MCNRDLRDEMRIANVRQWEVAEAIGVSEMTMVKWLRKELDDSKKALVREGISKAAQHKQKAQCRQLQLRFQITAQSVANM